VRSIPSVQGLIRRVVFRALVDQVPRPIPRAIVDDDPFGWLNRLRENRTNRLVYELFFVTNG
jgi:hypothetical protein